MEISFFQVICFVIAIAVIVAVLVVVTKMRPHDKTKISPYNYNSQNVVVVKIAKLRIFLFGAPLILIGFFCCFLFYGSLTFTDFGHLTFDAIFTLLLALSLLIGGLYAAYNGTKLLLNINNAIQLYFDDDAIHYLDVDYDVRGRAASGQVLKMFFSRPTLVIKFVDINKIVKDDSHPFTDKKRIRIYRNNDTNFSLPFLFYDDNQFDALYDALVKRWSAKVSS
ncbi:hypothetical protein [Soonwooa sp.]|uniref:hypothetical protein n=1 Tax=Soonwooa sp. TaxID=1938592 RepID=UPI002619A30A|nr:hypothetical protein [Soonwooa sp.]